jgi:hypothetical protein
VFEAASTRSKDMTFSVRGSTNNAFYTHEITVSSQHNGSYNEDGVWVQGDTATSNYKANVQPIDYRKRIHLEKDGQRLRDARQIYLSNAEDIRVAPADTVIIYDKVDHALVGEFRVLGVDIRKTRQYCKLIVGIVDE